MTIKNEGDQLVIDNHKEWEATLKKTWKGHKLWHNKKGEPGYKEPYADESLEEYYIGPDMQSDFVGGWSEEGVGIVIVPPTDDRATANTVLSKYKEWRAQLQTSYPEAEVRASSGDHMSEYAIIPATSKNVGWYDHEADSGHVLPKNETAAPKDAGNYTYFKLRSPKLTINRRGKPVVFKKGDPLGWRFSGSGKFLRLISPVSGPNIVYSLELTDDVLKWLDKQDPNSKRKRGQLKSDRPEDGQNRLEGYVVTDGTRYYKLEPKPIFSRKIKPRVLYTKEQDAKRFAAKFPQKKLKVKEVYTKDLGKVLSAATTTMPKMEFPGVKVTVPQSLRKVLLSVLEEMKVLSSNYISGYGDSSSTTWAVAFSIPRKFDLNKFQDQLREHLKYSGHLEVEYFDMVEED